MDKVVEFYTGNSTSTTLVVLGAVCGAHIAFRSFQATGAATMPPSKKKTACYVAYILSGATLGGVSWPAAIPGALFGVMFTCK